MRKLYGIKNCDTVKKTLKALNDNDIEFDFIDFKKMPPTPSQVTAWRKALGEWPVNTRGRTYKQLKDVFESANDKEKTTLICENSSLIKRPLLEENGKAVALGFEDITLRFTQ